MSSAKRHAAEATLETLPLFDARQIWSYVVQVQRNDNNPNLSIVARRMFRAAAEVKIVDMLDRSGLAIEPYLAAWRVVSS